MIKEQGISFMNLSTFQKIIDQIGENKLIIMNLHKDGESLLNKELPDMVEYALNKNSAETIHLNTNGTLINGKVGRGIIERGIHDITVSIDASYEETYQRFKKIKGLSKLEERIKRAIDYRNQINSPTQIRVKIMEFEDISIEEIDHFREKWTGVSDEVQVTGVHSWSGSIEDIKITDEINNIRYPCSILWTALAVNCGGKVSICNFDWNYSGVVGDIHSQTIKEIWNGPRQKEIRKMHLNKVWNNPEVCEECVGWVSSGDNSNLFHGKKEFL